MTSGSDQKEIIARLERIQYLLEGLVILKALQMNLSTHGVRRILKIRRERVSVLSRMHKKSMKSAKNHK